MSESLVKITGECGVKCTSEMDWCTGECTSACTGVYKIRMNVRDPMYH